MRTKRTENDHKVVIDPDPFNIAIVTACSAGAAIGAVIRALIYPFY